jgi:hypothetical protein
VHDEILEGGVKGVGLGSYKKAEWIKGRRLSTVLDPLLRTALDRGEASVIGLARVLKVDREGLEWLDSCLARCFIDFSLQPKHLSRYTGVACRCFLHCCFISI